jgi:alanine racemase
MTAPLMPTFSQAAAVLTIDLAALADNWRLLAGMAQPAQCAGVVKANAYGVGIEQAVPVLAAAGCRTFFVAHPIEGVRVRNVLGAAPGYRIYVLNGLQSHADLRDDYIVPGLVPVIGSHEELARWEELAEFAEIPVPTALHIDTGMNRLGLPFFASAAELRTMFANRTEGRLDIELMMSHFVSSEGPDDPLNERQIERFDDARALFPKGAASLANSSGIFLPQRPFYDLVRPGYALYGGNPTPGRDNPMKTVVTLTALIQQTRWVEVGETVGYDSQWTARRRSRLATLLYGYADGLPRSAGATDSHARGADVIIAGARCPLVGRISMDLSVADITDVPEDAVQAGMSGEFLGAAIGVDELGVRSGTAGYVVLTSLGSRFHRRYVGAADG